MIDRPDFPVGFRPASIRTANRDGERVCFEHVVGGDQLGHAYVARRGGITHANDVDGDVAIAGVRGDRLHTVASIDPSVGQQHDRG